MYIKDNITGQVRLYGTDCHDSLVISDDGKHLSYYNLQCGEGSKYGSYSFVTDENGTLPKDDKDLIKHGAEAYFNIGGFGDVKEILEKIKASIKEEADYAYADFEKYKEDVLGAELDELPDDDFRYGLNRAVEIINMFEFGEGINGKYRGDDKENS